VNSEYSPLEDDSVFLGFLNDALTGVSPGRLRRRVFLESELPSELCNFALDDEFYDPRRQAVFYALGFGMEYVGGMPPGRRINPVCAGKIFCQLIRLKEVTTHVRVGGEIGAAISMLISSLPRCIADGGASFADAIATVVAQPRTIELMDVSSPRSLQMTPDDVISAETLSSLLSFLHAEFEKLRFELLGFLASSHD
jgi:hypothetical protein